MSLFSKLKEYAPDIASAVISGGGSLPLTAIKLISTALGCGEDEESVAAAVQAATPEDILKLQACNNEFKATMAKIDGAEMQSARNMYTSAGGATSDKIAMFVMRWYMLIAVLAAVGQSCLFAFCELDAAVAGIIGNVAMLIIKGCLDAQNQVTGFHFGSSIGSKMAALKNK